MWTKLPTNRRATNNYQHAIDDLDEWIADNWDGDEWVGGGPHDTIFEIADGATPVYTSDLMQLAADNINLAVDEPGLGPAFDGSPTPVNIVAANVFEHIEQALWEYWNNQNIDI